jgi:HTH-type transcriptional regulator, sugar sensing transcriptional regulator
MANLIDILKNTGFSDKAAKIYLAALEIGEGSVQELARQAHIERTTTYYTLQELLKFGAVNKGKFGRKLHYMPTPPEILAKLVRERSEELSDAIPELQSRSRIIFKKPKVYFLYGVPGFKQMWQKIFTSGESHYRIVTDGESFLDYVKEKYVLNEIIGLKLKTGIRSKQLITNSPYARKILAKDTKEHRESKILPIGTKLPFTEIICGNLVVSISSRFENLILVVENESFAKTRRSIFDALWDKL